MAKPAQIKSIQLDEARLRLVLQETLQQAMKRPVIVQEFTHKPSPFATLFPADILKIKLQDGRKLSLFLKHLGDEQSQHPEKQRRDREIRIYEKLFTGDNLPVVKFFGSRWNETTNRFEVFLEYIDDWNLKYHSLEHWFTAARRLAHLHAHFATITNKLLASDFLLRFDANYFNEWANKALSEVASQSYDLAAKLKTIVQNYDRVIDLLLQQPITLVHNDPSPKNVIADRSSNPARICFVDWEMAGIGCGLLDLVHLKYGLDGGSDQEMRNAYCSELAGTDLLPATQAGLDRLFAACELHKTIYRLAFSTKWQLPFEKVARWVDETQVFFARV
jgi:thiamine kinase-like enzyme